MEDPLNDIAAKMNALIKSIDSVLSKNKNKKKKSEIYFLDLKTKKFPTSAIGALFYLENYYCMSVGSLSTYYSKED